MGKCFFNILATFAEFEVDLLRMRTREGMAIARAKGRLKGKAPKLSPTKRTVLLKLHVTGGHTIAVITVALELRLDDDRVRACPIEPATNWLATENALLQSPREPRHRSPDACGGARGINPGHAVRRLPAHQGRSLE